MKENRNFKVRALGEIAIRCNDLAPMVAFYRDVIGLDLMTEAEAPIVFFRIADGFGGHSCVLALFAKDAPVRAGLHPGDEGEVETGARSSLHHIALSLPYSEQEAVMAWYDRLGQAYRVEIFGWVGWRGVFTTDPEGNTVELVAYGAALKT